MEKKLFRFSFLSFIIFFMVVTSGCVKLNPVDNIPESPLGVIPKGFDWKTVKELSCTINVSPISGIGDNMIRVIKIFNSSLLNDGALIASGAAKPSLPYIVKITLPTALPTIYVQEILPNGVRSVKTVDITGTTLNISFTPVITLGAPLIANVSPSPTITIPANYDVPINNNNSLTLEGFSSGNGTYGNTYKSFLIPSGFTRTSAFDTKNKEAHAILYVKGVFRISSDMELNDISIVVLNGGRVELKNLTTKSAKEDIVTIFVEAGGTFVTSENLELSNGKYIVNKGTMTLAGDLEISNHSHYYNEGTLTLSKTCDSKGIVLSSLSYLYNSSSINCDKIEINSNSSVLNDVGSSIETKDWYQNTTTVTNNHGHIVATSSFQTGSDAVVNNFCYILVATVDCYAVAELKGSTLNLYEGSLFSCQKLKPYNLDINMVGGSMLLTGDIESSIHKMKVLSTSSSYSVFKCTGNVPDFRPTNTAEFNGKIEFVHTLMVEGSGTNGRVRYEAQFNNNGSILSKIQTKNIVATSCNDAAGQIVVPPPAIVDTDGDGVPAGTDVDDSDPTVAFVSYFPSANTWGTYAFEDLWPVKGDYDINDIVLGFKVTYYTNSSNLATGIRLDYNMRASGASYSLGAAIQLDNISASNVASVSGRQLIGTSPFAISSNGTESGVSLAVIPLFNNQTDVVSYSGYLNTETGNYSITPDMFVRIRLVTPVQQSNLAMSAFNLFIVANERGREVHLPTYQATSKFNTSLASGAQLYPGDGFKYIDGMMWGLMIPESFQYPLETNNITSAYLHFAQWATSGGVDYADWYMQKTGYKNPVFIYQY